jgi:hypothetical protein
MTKLTLLTTLFAGSLATTSAAQTPAPAAPPPSVAPAAPAPSAPRPPVAPFVVPDIQLDFDAPAFAFQGPQPPAPPAPLPRVFVGPGKNREEREYERGRAMIEQNRYEDALPVFDGVIADKGPRADAAMYWKAYSQFKLARRADALATLAALQAQYPRGAWLKDARALELEVKQASGQSISADAGTDDELRLLALRGIMQTDGDAALPVIEKMLNGSANVRIKDRALFLLAQSRSTRAREIIGGIAKGGGNPDLQRQAIRYLSMLGATSELADVARSEKDPELRRAAIRSLGISNQGDTTSALTAIYNAGDASVDDRKAVIEALGMHSKAAALVALARNEKNPELKTEIVRRLSVMKAPEARDYMLELLK